MRKEIIKADKKAAIVTLGELINFDSTRVRNVDILYFRDLLISLGRQCDIVSIKKKTEDADFYKDLRNTNINVYDEIYIYNAPLNYIAGVVGLNGVLVFKNLLKFKGDIYYLITDPEFPCFNIAERFRPLYDKHDGLDIGGDIYKDVTREDFDYYSQYVWPRITPVFIGDDYDMLYDYWLNRKKKRKSKLYLIKNDEWLHTSLNEYIAANHILKDFNKNKHNFSFDRQYDLVYYGYRRRFSQRFKTINKLYDQDGLNILNIGYDPEYKNCHYDVAKYMKHEQLFDTLCKSYATVIMGDEAHNNNIKTLRFYEALALDLVAFIWYKYDENKQFIKNKELKDFIYVYSPEDLRNKLEMIKKDEKLYRHICDLERQEVIDQCERYKDDRLED